MWPLWFSHTTVWDPSQALAARPGAAASAVPSSKPPLCWSKSWSFVCGPGGAEWSAKVRILPSHPPAASLVSGLLDSVLTSGSGGGGGESVVTVPDPAAAAAVGHTVDIVEIDGRTVECVCVKQGCVLAPTLLSLMLPVMLMDAYRVERPPPWIRIAYRTDGHLLNQRRMHFQSRVSTTSVHELLVVYDCAMNNTSEEEMQRSMDLFSAACGTSVWSSARRRR
ncbi:hypothetical protein SprV_0401398000 [Sparganum proliferum]